MEALEAFYFATLLFCSLLIFPLLVYSLTMELSIPHSSFGVPSIIPQRYKASSNDKRLIFMSIKPTTAKTFTIKSSNVFPSKCPTSSKLILPATLGEKRSSKSLGYGKNKRNSTRVHIFWVCLVCRFESNCVVWIENFEAIFYSIIITMWYI